MGFTVLHNEIFIKIAMPVGIFTKLFFIILELLVAYSYHVVFNGVEKEKFTVALVKYTWKL
jgi:hypothetical protein